MADELAKPGQGGISRIMLPGGATALSTVAFQHRYAQVFEGLVMHVAQRLGMEAETAWATVTRASLPGNLQVIQFADLDGEPGVFTVARGALTEEGQRFTDALVSYFDKSGSFDARTGEIAETDRLYLAPEHARILDAVEAQRLELVKDPLAEGTTLPQQTALAYCANVLGVPASEILARFAEWRATHADRDPAEFVQVLLPDNDESNRIGQDYQAFSALWNRVHEREIRRLEAHVQEFQTLAAVAVVDAKHARDTLEAKYLALKDQGAPTAEAVEALRKMSAEAGRLKRDIDVLGRFGEYAGGDPEFMFRLVRDCATAGITPKEFFAELILTAARYPDKVQRDDPAEQSKLEAELALATLREVKAAHEEFPPATLDEWIHEEYPDALDLFSGELRVSKRVVRETLDRWVSAGVLSFVRTGHTREGRRAIAGVIPESWPVFTSKTERGLKDLIEQRFKMFAIEKGADGKPKVTPHPAGSKVADVAKAMAHAAIKSGLSAGDFDKIVADISAGRRPSNLMPKEQTALRIIEEVRDGMSPAEWQAYLDDAFGKKPPAGNGNGHGGKNGSWPRPGEHTYMRAIEAQYGTLTTVLHMLQVARSSGQTHIAGMRIDDMLGHDAELLKRADTFCWFEEPILAVEAAAERLPDSVRLTRDLAEHHACWWYFTLPHDIPTTDVDDAVQALLWGWHESRLHFSTYVQSDKVADGLIPTARFSWVEGETLAHALQRVRHEHQHRTPEFKAAVGEDALMGEEETVRTVERLLRFFIAGCLWVQQTILVHSKGHIERHARKRMEKPNGFDRPLADVQIIMLRRRESVAKPQTGEAKTVDWQYQWIVGGATGFWRNQWYPSKGHYQLKWIGPYIKGPADKPLKVPQHRVYAVSR